MIDSEAQKLQEHLINLRNGIDDQNTRQSSLEEKLPSVESTINNVETKLNTTTTNISTAQENRHQQLGPETDGVRYKLSTPHSRVVKRIVFLTVFFSDISDILLIRVIILTRIQL